jgi:predicted phosphoribosyltransferase
MFYDRLDASQQLAKKLIEYKNNKNCIILGITRGGAVVGKEVAKILNIDFDILITKKISPPNNTEFAIGAVTESDEFILDEEQIGTTNITPDYLDEEIAKKREVIVELSKLYRKNQSIKNINNKIVIIIDDGIATGYTMLVAIQFAKKHGAEQIIIATPVISQDSFSKIKNNADSIIYISLPNEFFSVGQFYDQFDQISDDEVSKLLNS